MTIVFAIGVLVTFTIIGGFIGYFQGYDKAWDEAISCAEEEVIRCSNLK